MNIEEMQKEENFEHEVLDRLKCLDPSDFDYNAVDGSYVDAVLKARDVILTAYEKEKEKNKEITERATKFIEGRDIVIQQEREELLNYVKENYTSNDKIKAKIEEYDDKEMTINLTNRSAGKTFQQAVHYEVKKVLQSLLEKE